MAKLIMKEFIENIDLYLTTSEVSVSGCPTCDFGSFYGVDYNIRAGIEIYNFSTVSEYDSLLFSEKSLEYYDEMLVEDFVKSLEVISRFGNQKGTKLFLPRRVSKEDYIKNH